MFEKKQCRDNKIPDLSTLPPCHQVLQYHIKRSNVITYIWKQSLATNVDYPNITECRWEVNGDIHWADGTFPDQVENILFEENDSDSDDDYCGSDVESEDDLDEYL